MIKLPGNCRVPAVKLTHALRFMKPAIGAAALSLMAIRGRRASIFTAMLLAATIFSSGVNATGQDCIDCEMAGANYAGLDLTGIDYFGANLTNANFAGTNLSEANLMSADLTGANLDGADLTDAALYSADLTGATMMMTDTTGVLTDSSTTCPDGLSGPCTFQEVN